MQCKSNALFEFSRSSVVVICSCGYEISWAEKLGGVRKRALNVAEKYNALLWGCATVVEQTARINIKRVLRVLREIQPQFIASCWVDKETVKLERIVYIS